MAAICIVFAGCGMGPKAPDYSPQLEAWLDEQIFSSWETFRATEGEFPRKPDGFTLGNRHIFAGIGCNEKDLSQIDPLYGDEKSARAVASALRFSVRAGETSILLVETTSQRLRRVSGTAIIVGKHETDTFELTTIDFAPMDPGVNCLARLMVLTNRGETADFAVALNGTMGELRKQGRAIVTADGRLGMLSHHKMSITDGEERRVEIRLGRIEAGQSRSAEFLFVPARDRERLEAALEDARKKVLNIPLDALESTQQCWRAWRGRVKAKSGEPRLDDLMDSLLCLIKSHVGFEAIHTGSLRYPHTRAWVRDNYWVARACLEAGLTEEARLNLDFFFEAWKKSGVSSYYEVAGRAGTPYGNQSVELPHYLVLMVRDAAKLGEVDPRPYWPMVKGCLNKARVVRGGLQPINGDETWLLAAGIDQVYYVLNNSLLLMAAAEYGAELAQEVGDEESARRFRELARGAHEAIETYLYSAQLGRFVVAANGRDMTSRGMDEFPNAGVLARVAMLGVFSAREERVRKGLVEAWNKLSYKEGIRAYSRSGVVDGGTPGYFLYAASEAGLGQSHDLVGRMMENFCAATGSVWELQSVTEAKWGLEKRRLWDSAVLLCGLLKYCEMREQLPAAPHKAPVYAFSADGRMILEKAARGDAAEASDLVEGLLRLGDGRVEEFVILEEDSANHARELACQLARCFGTTPQVGRWREGMEITQNTIIISKNPEPQYEVSENAEARPGQGFAVIPIQNSGDVFRDLRDIEQSLCGRLVPVREPGAFPDADLRMAEKIGEEPQGEVEVKVSCDRPIKIACAGQEINKRAAVLRYDLSEELATPTGNLQIKTLAASNKTVALTVSARGGPETRAKVEVIFPAGYWVVEARNYGSGWDRTVDPIDEILQADGRRGFVFDVGLGAQADKSFTIKLARPLVAPYERETGPTAE